MATVTKKIKMAHVTFDEFCVVVKEDQKADLLDGVIYMASPENRKANKLFVWFIGLLEFYVEAKELGDVYGSRVAFRLNDTNGPEPDIAFVSKLRPKQQQTGYYKGPPDLAVEIVSPESVDRDYNKKRKRCEEAGVREYWILDELTEEVTCLVLNDKGKYQTIRPKKGVIYSHVVEGFWFRPEWLWQEPRPKKVELIKEILASSNS
jgi:Uma2 family endonuclease